MTIFINLEFKPSDFDQIDKALTVLSREGWEVVRTNEFSVRKPLGVKEITSKSYILKRTI